MKKVLITGASSGIGYELTKGYAMGGWQVYACGRNVSDLLELASVMPEILVLQFDVTDVNQTKNALSHIEFPLDLIILNAGNCEYVEKGKIDTNLFKRVFDINVFGVLNCIEALQDNFTEQTHIALMGSTASYLPLPRSAAYGASKAAISYIANSLAVDLEEKGVFISLISPGFVKTPLTDKNDFEMPMIISPEEAAKEIKIGLEKKQAEIHFPKKFSYFLKSIALLPIATQRKMMRRFKRN